MRKRTAFGWLTLLVALSPCVRADAPAPERQVTLGDTTVGFGDFSINTLTDDSLFSGGVTLTSPSYDLTAVTVTVTGRPHPEAGEQPYSKIDAEGSPATGVRVVGHFRQPVLGRSYDMEADHAVFTPSSESAGAIGTIVLTGQPIVHVTMPSRLAVPAPIVADTITITLGKDPQNRVVVTNIAGDNGHITLTPLPQTITPHVHPQRP